MPKRDKFKKQHNQPSVASIFTGNISTNSSPQAECENPNPPPSPESSTPITVPKGLDLSELTEDNRNFIPVNKTRRKKEDGKQGIPQKRPHLVRITITITNPHMPKSLKSQRKGTSPRTPLWAKK